MLTRDYFQQKKKETKNGMECTKERRCHLFGMIIFFYIIWIDSFVRYPLWNTSCHSPLYRCLSLPLSRSLSLARFLRCFCFSFLHAVDADWTTVRKFFDTMSLEGDPIYYRSSTAAGRHGVVACRPRHNIDYTHGYLYGDKHPKQYDLRVTQPHRPYSTYPDESWTDIIATRELPEAWRHSMGGVAIKDGKALFQGMVTMFNYDNRPNVFEALREFEVKYENKKAKMLQAMLSTTLVAKSISCRDGLVFRFMKEGLNTFSVQFILGVNHIEHIKALMERDNVGRINEDPTEAMKKNVFSFFKKLYTGDNRSDVAFFKAGASEMYLGPAWHDGHGPRSVEGKPFLGKTKYCVVQSPDKEHHYVFVVCYLKIPQQLRSLDEFNLNQWVGEGKKWETEKEFYTNRLFFLIPVHDLRDIAYTCPATKDLL